MKVRRASRGDLEQVRELVGELGYDGTETGISSQLDAYIESNAALLLVAENSKGTLSGMIAGHLIPLIHQAGSVGRITSFVVRANDRSSGIGTALLEAMESWFSERECLRFEVQVATIAGKPMNSTNRKGTYLMSAVISSAETPEVAAAKLPTLSAPSTRRVQK